MKGNNRTATGKTGPRKRDRRVGRRSDLSGFTLTLLHALARDVATVDPWAHDRLVDEFGVLEELQSSGRCDLHRLWTTYFPKLGKWFDKLLSSLMWCEPPLEPTLEEVYEGRIPILDALFDGLHSHLSDRDWDLDPNLVLMARQLCLFRKRHVEPFRPGADLEAAREFWSTDQGLRTPRSLLSGLMRHYVSGTFAEGLSGDEPDALTRMVKVMDQLSDWLAPVADLDPWDVIPKHGPGAVSDKSCNLMGDKYSFRIWSEVFQDLFPHEEFCTVNYRYNSPVILMLENKYPARLIAVPKTYDKPRLIASEPTTHQYLQQGLLAWGRANMCSTHKVMIDFLSQEPSKKDALKASIDGQRATIDLSSASDRVSTWCVEALFRSRPVFLKALLDTRSDMILDPISGDVMREIRKFAPMGSAVTFFVQSLLYANAAIAAAIVWDGRDKRPLTIRDLRRYARRIRVFGDDIICRSDTVPYLCLLFNFLQLKINPDKTHTKGYFRESCGMDAYKGYSVTPAYISHEASRDSPIRVLLALLEQSNNAHRLGLWHLAARLADLTCGAMRAGVVTSRSSMGCVSLYTFTEGQTLTPVPPRFEEELQVWEVPGLALNAPRQTLQRGNQVDLLQYYLEYRADTGDDIPQVTLVGLDLSIPLKIRRKWVDARSTALPLTEASFLASRAMGS